MQYTKPRVMSRWTTRGALLAASTLAMVRLSAQTSAPAADASDDVVKLSPFSVAADRDSGYSASNSIAGTRTNTPIRDIAMNIQVFTKDMASDLVMADHTQLERYNAALVNGGADVQSEVNIQQAYNSFLFRGFIQNWGMRDGIREYDPVDAQGLARVEIVKGPAAALYGLSYAGGVMNSISKTVDMSRSFGAVRITGYSEGGYRGTVDANYVGKAADGKFGVRFNGAGSDISDARKHSKANTRFTQTNLAWQPVKGTDIALLVENSWRQKANGLGYYGRSPTAGVASEQGRGVVIPLQADHPDIPWTWNWANGSNPRSLDTALYRLTVNQAVGENLYVNAYIQNNRHQNIDSNGWDDNGNSQNAAGWDVTDFSSAYPASGWINPGTPNERIRRIYHWRDWSNSVHAYGANAVYKFEVAKIKNTVTLGGAKWEERFWSNKYLQPATTTTFFDLPVRKNIDTTAPSAPTDFAYTNGGNREHNMNRYVYLNYQISAIDNRLKLNAAVNKTKIRNYQWASPDAGDYNHPNVDVSKSSPMFGGMFDITKQVSVFAVHSTSLFPTTDKNDFMIQMPPEEGKSNEFGVKVELLDGKISGTASYYNIKKKGGGVRDVTANNRNKLIWDSLTAAQRTARGWSATDRDSITTGDGITGSRGDLVPGEQESKGYEADVMFQPTRSLQLVLSYAHNQQESTKGESKGETVGGHIKDQFSGLTKYTFLDGAMKGFSVGLGGQLAGKALQGYQNDAAGRKIARYNPSTMYVEMFATYRFKAFGFEHLLQLNAKNLTEQEDFYGWKPTGNADTVAMKRYKVPNTARLTLTWGMDF